MREVRISLSEERLADIEAEVASGQFESVAEVIERAVAAYLQPAELPSEAEMIAEFEAMRRDVADGVRLLDPDEVERMVGDSLRA